VLTRDGLIKALQQRGGTTPVLEIMDRDIATVPENACLDNVLERLQRSATRVVGVVDPAGRLVGYITAENLSELIMIQSSRASSPGAPKAQKPERIL
jgi:stage IV sporulation protein FB